jgi:peptidoglycan/LPS O-acetylase OafA/YrhL
VDSGVVGLTPNSSDHNTILPINLRLDKGRRLLHRDDIDGLRAVAVIPVLLFHFKTGLFSGGFTGVDIFFVISGFVIATSISADMKRRDFSIANFYFKRIRRIFPAFVAVVTLSTVVAIVILLPPDLVDYNRSLIATGWFVSNIYFWKASGYFATSAQLKPLLHTWSLSVEEQYYLIAPLAFVLIGRFGNGRWLVYLTPFITLSFFASVAAVFVAPTANFFLFPTRMWELLLGASIAFSNRPAPTSLVIRNLAASVGLLMILFGLIMINEDDPFPGWNALYPCIGTAFVIQSGIGLPVPEMPAANRLLATRPFVAIGLISYSLYLVHWPVVAYTRYLTLREPSTLVSVLMLAGSLGLAWLSWRYIERPFRRIGRTRRRWVLLGGAAAMLAIFGIGSVGILKDGFPLRYPDFVDRNITGVEDWGGDLCFHQNPSDAGDWSAEACTRIHGTNGRILLWGDSFAAQYMPGILRDAKRINADVLQYTFAGCPPILAYFSVARLGCSLFNSKVMDIIAAQRIDTVVIAGRWTDVPLRTLSKLQETIVAIEARGLRVFVFGQSPQFIADIQHIDYISGLHGKPGKAFWPVSFDRKLNAQLESNVLPATFIDPLRHLCDAQECAYRDGETFYYADYGHFSTAGSVIAVQRYFPAGLSPLGVETKTH